MKTINPIRKELVKQEYIKSGGNGYKSLKAGGLAESTARHKVSDKNRLLKVVKQEILDEIDKEGLVKSAYKTLKDNLTALKASDRNTAASSILDFIQGKKLESKVTQVNDIEQDKAYRARWELLTTSKELTQ